MKKIIRLLLMAPTILFGMEQKSTDDLKDADWALWRSIDYADYNGMLDALAQQANPNYLWPKDEQELVRYADLTPSMYAIKRLREENRKKYISTLASNIAWDIGKAAVNYTLSHFTAQYPAVTHLGPILQSRTSTFLWNTQSGLQQTPENTYSPAKRLLLDLLMYSKTDLALKRKQQWKNREGKLYDVTAFTYLNLMVHSWNSLTRTDGIEISGKVSQAQRKKVGITVSYDPPSLSGGVLSRPGVTVINGDMGQSSGQRSYFSNDTWLNDYNANIGQSSTQVVVNYYDSPE